MILSIGLVGLAPAPTRGEGVPAFAGGRGGRGAFRVVGEALSGSYATEHLDLRFRPGSRAESNAERTGAMMERELARICTTLEVKNDRRFRVFLFDDIGDLKGLNHTDEFVEGFAMGNTIHVPFENTQTVIHELVHLVARAKIGRAPGAFLTEGLANALLESSRGVQVHAVAKYFRLERQLPRLSRMLATADFTTLVKKQRLNGYDIAASWMRFLLETHGVEKLKQYYLGRPPQEVFGLELEALEAKWWDALDRYPLRPEVKALLATRSGRQPFGVITVNPGEMVALTATPTGDLIATEFRWSKDGFPLDEAADATLTLKKVSAADGGNYEVLASDSFEGPVRTYRFRLVVIPSEVSSRP